MKLLSLTLFAIFLNAAGLAVAFEGFFGNMFNQQQDPRQHQRQRGHSPQFWNEQSQAVGCAEYLCPSSLVCVSNPKDCPCPHPQDVRCVMPDDHSKSSGTVMCLSGSKGCHILDRFAKW